MMAAQGHESLSNNNNVNSNTDEQLLKQSEELECYSSASSSFKDQQRLFLMAAECSEDSGVSDNNIYNDCSMIEKGI
jgi:hypothetical protein